MEYGVSRYGLHQYGNNLHNQNGDSDFDYSLYLMMLDYIPRYYHEMREAQEIIANDSTEINILRKKIDDLINQFFIDTATWGLSLWESQFNIKTDLSLTYEQRRSIVKSKMRGSGTTTENMIKNVASSFSGGEVEIVGDYANYSFQVKFVGTLGVPKKIDDLETALKDIIPAHLNFSFAYTYLTWNRLSGASWNDVRTNSWGELKTNSEFGG